jgi:hypothetical protein
VEFSKQRADVTFEVRDVYCSDDCHEQLRRSALDVVFTRPPFDEMLVDATPIVHERPSKSASPAGRARRRV